MSEVYRQQNLQSFLEQLHDDQIHHGENIENIMMIM